MFFKSLIRISALVLIMSQQPEALAQSMPAGYESELPFKKIIFRVIDLKTNTELANGIETIDYKNGSITKNTEYYDVDKNRSVIQTELATTNLASLIINEYRFKNIQTGEEVELSMSAPPVAMVTYIPKKDDKPQKSQYRWTDRTVIGKTLHHFIIRNWKALIAGKSPDFELYVPMKRDQFKFRIRKDRDVQFKDQTAHVVSLEPANWAIRALVPRMDFFYTMKNGIPLLVRYEGATTVAINGDDKRDVAIEFTYES
jgi:hypothetical protein